MEKDHAGRYRSEGNMGKNVLQTVSIRKKTASCTGATAKEGKQGHKSQKTGEKETGKAHKY